MDFRQNNILRIVSTIVLALFFWTFGGGIDIAFAIKSSQISSSTKNSKKEKKPEEKLHETLDEIEAVLKDKAIDKVTKKNKLKLKKKDIDSLDGEIQSQFTSTEEKIKDLPEIIRQRHRDFVKHYQDNHKEFKNNLDAINKAKTDAEIEAEIEKTKTFLKKVKPPKKHTPLDPNKLPHRFPKAKEVKLENRKIEKKKIKLPKLRKKKAGYTPDSAILFASNDSLSGLFDQNSEFLAQNLELQEPFMIAAADPPTDADLSETIEVQFTPAIQAKAEELENKPVKIYNWVRNNIEFVPTYGSIQGADYCLQTKLCNAYDTASLLIALLRVSDIHARYAEGTVEISIERVMNWVGGFTDPMSALNLLASVGIPVTGQVVGGEVKYARIEHVWVEAYVPYGPYSGRPSKLNPTKTWIPLDPSFKQYNYIQGMDIQTAVPFDAQSFVDQILATATINEEEGYATGVDSLFIQQTMEDYQTQVENYITQNYPNATVGDVLGKKEIIKQELGILPATLPYRTIVKGSEYASIPDNLRHRISFKVVKDMYDELLGTPLNISKSLPEIAGKKITLSYSPATQADEDVINSFLPKPHEDGTPIDPSELPSSLPAYLINVKPKLRLDGEVVGSGSSAGLGQKAIFTMTFIAPNTSSDVIQNEITAGEYYGIAIDTGRVSKEQMEALKTKLETTKTKLETQNFEGITKDDILGDLLYTTALTYYAVFDVMDHVQAKTKGLLAIRLPSEAHFSTELSVYSVFGTPISVSSGGLAMDVDRIMTMVKSLDGDLEKPIQFFLSSGMNGSALEHSVPEQLFSTPENLAEGISAVKALQIANDQGIPIYTVNKDNINTILPQLQIDSETIKDIKNSVNAGMEVTVSKTDITFNGWTGHGYIVIDPNTGAGAYMIAGGMNGALLIEGISMLRRLLLGWLPWVDEPSVILDSYGDAFKLILEGLGGIFEYWADYLWHCYILPLTQVENADAVFGAAATAMTAVTILVKNFARIPALWQYILIIGGSILYISSVATLFFLGMRCIEERKRNETG